MHKVCVLVCLAAEAGDVSPAKDLSCRPAAGHFQRRIDDFTVFRGDHDVLDPRLENDRVVTEITFLPPSVASADTLPQSVANKNSPERNSSIQ